MMVQRDTTRRSGIDATNRSMLPIPTTTTTTTTTCLQLFLSPPPHTTNNSIIATEQSPMAHNQTVIPDSVRHLRACLNCCLIKTMSQFKSNGCENCHPRPQKLGADGRPETHRKKEIDADMEQYMMRHTTTEFNGYMPASIFIRLFEVEY
jgi:hypothetical protein